MNTIEAALTGRMGTEPELKTSQAGKLWAAFNVGVGKPPKAKPSTARESAAAAHQQPTTSAAIHWQQPAGDATIPF